MNKLILVTGGSGSGKSEYAEKLALNLHEQNRKKLIYLATMKSTDKECDNKIDIHRKRREHTAFETIEKQVRIGEIAAEAKDVILLECISNLLANEMYSAEGRGQNCRTDIVADIMKLHEMCDLVIVSNEVSYDGIAYDEYTVEYIKAITYINSEIAKEADHVYEVVVGIPILQK